MWAKQDAFPTCRLPPSRNLCERIDLCSVIQIFLPVRAASFHLVPKPTGRRSQLSHLSKHNHDLQRLMQLYAWLQETSHKHLEMFTSPTLTASPLPSSLFFSSFAWGCGGSYSLYSKVPLNSSSSTTFCPVFIGSDSVFLSIVCRLKVEVTAL